MLVIIARHESSLGVWLSLVKRYVRDVEIGGSNPLTPTIGCYCRAVFDKFVAQPVPSTGFLLCIFVLTVVATFNNPTQFLVIAK